MQFTRREYNINYILNTALCQSPPGANKTQKAMMYIHYAAIMSRFADGTNENGIHHITFLATNNNLEETKQWKLRTSRDKHLRLLKILVLSSNKGDINNVDKIIAMIAGIKKADDLPDIIIFCTHHKRIDDMVRLIQILNEGNINLSNKGIRQITATAMFDEPDENIVLVCDFLKEMSEIRTNYVVRDVHFITATPLKKFWDKIRDAGVNILKNINSVLKAGYSEDEYPEIHMTFRQLMQKYRKIEDHNIRYDVTEKCKHPVEYASLVLNKILENRTRTHSTDPLTIFAPAESCIKTHIDMKNIFKLARFYIAIHNGEYKGFYTPTGEFESYDDFNKKNGVTGEFRDTLSKWREMNPSSDLVITGYYNVQRGITFCTTGFNFTDFIVSDWHMKNLAALIQILGRANGGIEYVKVMNIWSRKEVIDAANEQIEIMNNILEQNPEEFTENDFRKKSKSEIEEISCRVPKIIQLSEDEYRSINKIRSKWNEQIIFELIRIHDDELYNEIKLMSKDQITEPKTQSARKKHIDDLCVGAQENKKKSISIKKDNKKKDVYQIFMDNLGHRLIVTRYYGTRLINENISDDESDDEE